MEKKKKKKKRVKKEANSILKTLVPDHLKRVNDNSGWCGTVSFKPKTKRFK